MSTEHPPWPEAVRDEDELEELLSRPSAADVAFARTLADDVIVLGAGGKVGPSLARRVRRAFDAAGVSRRVLAVDRFSEGGLASALERDGIETIACDLLDPAQVAGLPKVENVLFLAGRKFGSTDRPDLTWAQNVVVPAIVAPHFAESRIVVFSSGNVYPLVRPGGPGSTEKDPVGPVGEYAQTCVGRERVFEHASRERGTRCLFFRLFYAVDLRYGTLVDVARKVHAREPVALHAGHVNALWQGDAGSYAFRALVAVRDTAATSGRDRPRGGVRARGGEGVRGALRSPLAVHGRAGERSPRRPLPLRLAPRATRGASRAAPRLGGGVGRAGRAQPRQADPLRGDRWPVLRALRAAGETPRGPCHPGPPPRPDRGAAAGRAPAGRSHPLLRRRRRRRDRGGRPLHPVRDPGGGALRAGAAPRRADGRRGRTQERAPAREDRGGDRPDEAGGGGGGDRPPPRLRRRAPEPRGARARRPFPSSSRTAGASPRCCRSSASTSSRRWAAGSSTRASGGASSRSRRWWR